jgi:hypothetical protein
LRVVISGARLYTNLGVLCFIAGKSGFAGRRGYSLDLSSHRFAGFGHLTHAEIPTSSNGLIWLRHEVHHFCITFEAINHPM